MYSLSYCIKRELLAFGGNWLGLMDELAILSGAFSASEADVGLLWWD
jgi:hypothetical protein